MLMYRIREVFTVQRIKNFSSLSTVLNQLFNRWSVVHVAWWLLGSILRRQESLDGVIAPSDVMYVTSSSTTVVVSRRMELIQQSGHFWRSYSSFVLADTENNKGTSMMFLLMPSLLRPVWYIIRTSVIHLYLHLSVLVPITGTGHSPYVF